MPLADFDTYEIWSVTGKVSIDFDFATLVAVLNYSDQDKITSLDVDSGPGPHIIVMGDSELDWYTQELRLEGETDRSRWIAGTYYMMIDGEFSQALSDTLGGINPFASFFGAVIFGDPAAFGYNWDASFDAFLETKSFSLFGQVDYDLTDKLMFSLGARGIWEKKDFEYQPGFFTNTRDATVESLRSGNEPVVPFVANPAHDEETDDFLWSGRAGLQYAHNDDLMLYATFNRGVKAGGCNTPLLTFLFPQQYCYDEEILLAYEAGFKSTLMDGRMRVNGTFYYYDYSDYQAFQFIGTSGVVINADGEYYGGEVEIFANPIDNLDLIFGIAYIDPVVKDVSINTDPPTPDGRIFNDVEPTFTPEVQFNALGRYTWPLTGVGGSLALQVDGNYASSAFHNINNFDTQRMPSYWRGNASLSWYSADERIEVTGFIDNFSDTRNVNIGFELSAFCGCDEQSVGWPRTYGVKLRYNYF